MIKHPKQENKSIGYLSSYCTFGIFEAFVNESSKGGWKLQKGQ